MPKTMFFPMAELLATADDHAQPAMRGRGQVHPGQPKLKTASCGRVRRLADYGPATAAEFTEVHYPDGIVIILRGGIYAVTFCPRPDAHNRRRFS